jgi:hypothetical protein
MDDHDGRAIRRPGRLALVLALVLVGVAAAGGSAWLAVRQGPGPAGVSPATAPPPSPPVAAAPATTTTATAPARPAGRVVLRPDGLGAVAFGAAEQEAVRALRRSLGPWAERGSWPTGATAFGTCVGAVKALRWGRLYVLFTNGPTPYGPEGRWHLFAYQVLSWKVFPVIPSGPERRLTGYSPRTAEGIGLGATVARLRAAYGKRLEVWASDEAAGDGFTVAGDPTGLHGTLTNASPTGRVKALLAGQGCGE